MPVSQATAARRARVPSAARLGTHAEARPPHHPLHTRKTVPAAGRPRVALVRPPAHGAGGRTRPSSSEAGTPWSCTTVYKGICWAACCAPAAADEAPRPGRRSGSARGRPMARRHRCHSNRRDLYKLPGTAPLPPTRMQRARGLAGWRRCRCSVQPLKRLANAWPPPLSSLLFVDTHQKGLRARLTPDHRRAVLGGGPTLPTGARKVAAWSVASEAAACWTAG
ncbi:MAG: hypothetical protein J3K34DRAFT_252199 [Monoraphidium minutum]|nr:MAG: hypothetical protein J3K34DRAFT_252199 [Monoraphidium minutum]